MPQGDIKERTILNYMFNKSSSEFCFLIYWKIYLVLPNDIRYYIKILIDIRYEVIKTPLELIHQIQFNKFHNVRLFS